MKMFDNFFSFSSFVEFDDDYDLSMLEKYIYIFTSRQKELYNH